MANNSLQMAYAEINKDKWNHWMYNEHIQDPDLGMQRLITSVFGSLEATGQGLRPYRLQTNRKKAVFYGYTTADASALKRCVQVYADPMVASILSADTIMCKPMPDDWNEGDQIGFEIRVRPTYRKNQWDPQERPKEIDCFQAILQDHKPENGPRPQRSEVYGLWLRQRFANQGGALPYSTRLAYFDQVMSYRKPKGKGFRLPTCVMQGNLTVTDVEKFRLLLRKGIGRARGYGYGMLLLRPIIEH